MKSWFPIDHMSHGDDITSDIIMIDRRSISDLTEIKEFIAQN